MGIGFKDQILRQSKMIAICTPTATFANEMRRRQMVTESGGCDSNGLVLRNFPLKLILRSELT
jgi:hypothetical protein